MENETTEPPQPKKLWVTPSFTVLSVNDETLGGIGSWPDFFALLS